MLQYKFLPFHKCVIKRFYRLCMRKMTKRCLERMIQRRKKNMYEIYVSKRQKRKTLQKRNYHYVGAECVRFKWRKKKIPIHVDVWDTTKRRKSISSLCFYKFSTENLCFLERLIGSGGNFFFVSWWRNKKRIESQKKYMYNIFIWWKISM